MLNKGRKSPGKNPSAASMPPYSPDADRFFRSAAGEAVVVDAMHKAVKPMADEALDEARILRNQAQLLNQRADQVRIHALSIEAMLDDALKG